MYIELHRAKLQLALLFILQASLICRVYAAEPKIESVSFPVVQQGQALEILIEGEGFEGCHDVVFYSEKIRCASFEVKSDYELAAKIVVDANCPILNQPFRVLSKFGYSDMRTLRVTPFPIIRESVEGPTQVLDTRSRTYCGVLESGDIDVYRIPMKQGQRLSAEVEAVRLGYELLDTVLVLRGPDGVELLRVDDDPLFQQDPVLSFEAPKDGIYELSLHETNFSGSQTSYYALHLGDFHRPSATFPAGGKYGEVLDLQFMGPTGKLAERECVLPSLDKAKDFQLSFPNDRKALPTPLPFRLGNLLACQEEEPNNQWSSVSQFHPVPGAFDGIIGGPGDVDYFGFALPLSELNSSARWKIEVFADRIGSPIDTSLRLLDPQGRLVASNDDWGSHDSCIEFQNYSDQDTHYILEVADKLDGGKPNGVYRVEVTPIAPKLTTFLPRPDRVSQAEQTISVPRGNKALKRVAIRREYVDGLVQIRFMGLPPGVHASPVAINADQFWVPAVLTADSDSQLGGSLASIEGSCRNNNEILRGGFEQTVDLVHSTADQLFNSITVDRIPIAITPEVPFEVVLIAPPTSLPSGGRMQVLAQVKRAPGFEEPVRVRLPFLPPWVVSDDYVIVGKGETQALFELAARPQAETRAWQLVASATVDALSAEGEIAEFEGREVCSDPVELQIVENPLEGELGTLACELGEDLRVVCRVSGQVPVAGDLLAELEGLPARVSAQPVIVADPKKPIEFKLLVEAEAPVGSFEGIYCRLTSQSKSQVSYRVANDTRLTIYERGKLKRDSRGKLLSPLDALRTSSSTSK